ncbi:MAG: hypothetical protein ACYDA6_00950 [Solirubrobacteraceae bacterium]
MLRIGRVSLALVLAGTLLGAMPLTAQASVASGSPEWYKNGQLASSGSHLPVFGDGFITFESSEKEPGVKELEIECMNILYGGISNEGSPLRGHAQILEWWAMGHVQAAEHTEVSSLCRFTYLGGPAGEAWVTAERPLEVTQQEAIVCDSPNKKLTECEATGETERKEMIREVRRAPLTTPWNSELVVKGSTTYAKIGVPTEAGKSCSEEPAPPGCMRLTILYPEINLQLPIEGSLEAKLVNGAKNGLSPSELVFEGTKSGSLTIPGSLGETVFASGKVKLLGAEGRELLNAE